jgi:hypothetical protein
VQREFFCVQTIKIRGENDGIFGWGFLHWIPAGTKHFLSAVSISTLTFPRVLWQMTALNMGVCSVANACLCRGYNMVEIPATSVEKF